MPPMPASTAKIIRDVAMKDPPTKKYIIELAKLSKKLAVCN
jgi:hypothetical protein